jgi:Large eukaryotic DNA virus major capsid protein/Major capsid protein N-terminus
MYAVVQLAAHTDTVEWGYVRRLGYALIEETKVEIGGSKIDEQYGDWLNVWHELSHKVGQERGHAAMIGDDAAHKELSESHDASTLYVPLAYWFNRHNGLALPLIALQYHDVRVTIKYRAAADCVNYKGTSAPSGMEMSDSYLLIDYVFLDSEERKRFAQASHEYLIEQLQFTGSESLTSTNNKYRLNFNHPSKYLVWAPHLEKHANATQWAAYADDDDWEAARERFAKLVWLATRMELNGAAQTINAGGDNNNEVVSPNSVSLSGVTNSIVAKVQAQLVFTDASSSAPASVGNVVLLSNMVTAEDMTHSVAQLVAGGADSAFLEANGVTVVDHFNYGRWVDRTANPVSTSKLQLNGHDRFEQRDGNYFNYVQPYQHFSNTPADGINVYSFALKPEDHQPSGTCNFSRIDNATLNVSVVDGAVATDEDSNLNIYTVNYNVLRVMSGMAGTAYSN